MSEFRMYMATIPEGEESNAARKAEIVATIFSISLAIDRGETSGTLHDAQERQIGAWECG